MIRFMIRRVQWLFSVAVFNIALGFWTIDEATRALNKLFAFIYTFGSTSYELIANYVTTSSF